MGQGTDRGCPMCRTLSDNLPASFPSFWGRLKKEAQQESTQHPHYPHSDPTKPQSCSHHNLLEDKLHVLNLPFIALHVNYTSLHQIFTNAFVLCALQKAADPNHKRIAQFVESIFAVTSSTDHMGRNYSLIPSGQDTPVPPRPQYPSGFLLRYCWW